MDKPRIHHYDFAHQHLPELEFRFNDSFLSLLKETGAGLAVHNQKKNGYLQMVCHRYIFDRARIRKRVC